MPTLTERAKKYWDHNAELIFIVGAVLVVIILSVAYVHEHHKWERWCEGQGGHVKSHTSWSTGVDSNGKTVQTSDTTYYCLNADGGIIDIE